MPMPDYVFKAAVLIACSGDQPVAGVSRGDGPKGMFVSKAQSRLSYAIADVEAWHAHFEGPETHFSERLNSRTLVPEATRDDVQGAIADAVERLDSYRDEGDFRGGTLRIVFSGHGRDDGNLVVADGELTPDELMEWASGGMAGRPSRTRHLQVVFDSCYSGMTLARMLAHPHHWERVVLRDGFAASLPREEAFELERYRHGALTFVSTRPRVDEGSLIAGDPEALKEHRRQERETVAYLTNGQQHSLDLINGHSISVGPRRDVEVAELGSADAISDALHEALTKPLPPRGRDLGPLRQGPAEDGAPAPPAGRAPAEPAP